MHIRNFSSITKYWRQQTPTTQSVKLQFWKWIISNQIVGLQGPIKIPGQIKYCQGYWLLSVTDGNALLLTIGHLHNYLNIDKSSWCLPKDITSMYYCSCF